MPGSGGWNINFAGGGTNGAVLATDPPGCEPIDQTRNALILLGGLVNVKPLTCGSRQTVYYPAVADTFEDHSDYLDIPIDWTALKGDEGDTWTAVIKVSLKCENSATTVTPRLVTAGTSTVNVTGSAHVTTSWGVQTLTIASGTGIVEYRLQIKRSDLVYGVYCVAEGRFYYV